MAVNPDWMDQWLALENKKGRISDIYGFHVYLGPGTNGSPKATPRRRDISRMS
jgi:hypothetical protein